WATSIPATARGTPAATCRKLRRFRGACMAISSESPSPPGGGRGVGVRGRGCPCSEAPPHPRPLAPEAGARGVYGQAQRAPPPQRGAAISPLHLLQTASSSFAFSGILSARSLASPMSLARLYSFSGDA